MNGQVTKQLPSNQDIKHAVRIVTEDRAETFRIEKNGHVSAYYRVPYSRQPDWHDLGSAVDLVKEFCDWALQGRKS